MAERMAVMSTMMRRMSSLEARPAMKPTEWQKQMDQMRKQMDEMMRNSLMRPSIRGDTFAGNVLFDCAATGMARCLISTFGARG